jgi:hypothetical protein
MGTEAEKTVKAIATSVGKAESQHKKMQEQWLKRRKQK